MKKKLVSIALASSLVIGMTFGNSMQSVNAASQTQIDSDDVLTTLNDITIAGQAWENIGFESDDIAEIMQMQRKDSSYYEALSTNISQLSLVTSETEELENSIIEQGYIEPYAQDGNPPETPQEQNERLQYVTQVALNRYSSKYNTTDFEKYVLYLYMSHYIDNPNCTKESPGFDSIYAYVITSDDITAYDNFIAQTNLSMFSTSLINFVSEFKTAVSSGTEILSSINNGKVISLNTAQAVYDLSTYDPDKTSSRASLVITSIKNHYETTSSAEELLNAIYADLEEEDVDQQYIETCVSGLLGVLAGTTTILGFGMSISLCYYNFYSNLYDKEKLTALHYSLSGRVAIRLDELIRG